MTFNESMTIHRKQKLCLEGHLDKQKFSKELQEAITKEK